MSTSTNIIITIVVVIALAIGGYLLFFNSNTSAVSTSNAAPASAAEQTFLNLTAEAQSISFNTSILSDPRFTSLVDTRTTVVPVPLNRTDPFSPIAGVSGN
jgi:flagellar basal body-associated protein FliL